ncbi:SGNH/GDSL hydrolase family protein [Algoriphagus zhangzhouensis]|uniref:N-terminus of Esterase_SGNH_hydro-type n=1 Tax=Algoriphagus zhangzhouensis TaxID=1073327 RepID=A0A1M7Z4T1_9BACT|nr:SGNH/GDSL hydrolase family protein [Algoriphagus zhangzhouensis]TDY48738.1 SGNH-like hydrolase/esterase family protein [Algoriphagus zhangzhouensis]SHO59879.1 N-terminus of Esterase_SGNH_hydro-type [Algoriphagus zhangzhouensis]
MRATISLITLLFCVNFFTYSQEFKWFKESPEMMAALEGRGWDDIGFNRLPVSAEEQVRKPVWNLSRQTAGLVLRFSTSSEEIKVNYEVTGNLNMYHMPTTGVSGLDLYTKDENGNWLWIKGNYNFSDSVKAVFRLDNSQKLAKDFYLFFPLYNGLKRMEIGVKAEAEFAFLTKRAEKPILVYGTSIAQGACASRPGMAWTGILERDLDYPVINLAFSGNGRMEKEVVDLVNEVDAGLFVIDCLPNLGPGAGYIMGEIQEKYLYAVKSIRQKHPEIPILLTEHAGYSDGLVNEEKAVIYEGLNVMLKETFQLLENSAVKGVYYLTKEEINLGVDDFVDGTHPNDLGMYRYAKAYEKKLKEIMKK